MVALNMLRKCERKHVFYEEGKISFLTVVNQNKFRKQVKLPISLRACAPISEYPSDIITLSRAAALNFNFCDDITKLQKTKEQ